jgi:hypothetical protein
MTQLPGQTSMFEEEVTERFPDAVFTQEPLMVTITAKMKRRRRGKCDNCGKRRIGYYIDLSGYTASPILCAKCAGLR